MGTIHPAIKLLRRIPRSRVVTYKEMARACKTSPRVIGRIMAQNKDPIRYPCYKVVASNGSLCGYSARGGMTQKRTLLKAEGVTFRRGRVDLKRCYSFSVRDLICVKSS